MNFSHFFIRRPIFAGVLSIVIFLVGLISMWRLPISEYPEVVPPTIVVRAIYPGANPKTIAETVASPLEQAINGEVGGSIPRCETVRLHDWKFSHGLRKCDSCVSKTCGQSHSFYLRIYLRFTYMTSLYCSGM